MWQRFTERARIVVFYAQEEAGRLSDNYVSTEHLLLGLLRVDNRFDSVAVRILDRIGVSREKIRSETERQTARGDGRPGQDMQLTPRAKRVIDLAYQEARLLNNNYIGTEHLLLGLIGEREGLAGRVLSDLGVDLDRTRATVVEFQQGGSSTAQQSSPGALAEGEDIRPPGKEPGAARVRPSRPSRGCDDGWERFTEPARAAIYYAHDASRGVGASSVSMDFLILGLLHQDGSVAARVLESLGISRDAVRARVEPRDVNAAVPSDRGTRLAPRAKRAIDFAYDEARRLKNSHVGTEHLLLGLIREDVHEGLAGRVLSRLGLRQPRRGAGALGRAGVDLEPARQAVSQLQASGAAEASGGATEESAPERSDGGGHYALRKESGRAASRVWPPPATPAGYGAGPQTGGGTSLWHRYTERARRVVFYSQEEAGRFGVNYVSTEHLLLGLVRDDDSVAARVLDGIGASREAIRAEIELQVTRGDGRLGPDVQLSSQAKRALDLAYDEARRLKNNYIGTEHLLLGLIREEQSMAAQVLAKFGVDADRARSDVIRLQAGGGTAA
ncbi:MAG: Clp protease N-terminal domain-containing protein [Capsulimonadaceae bacterium]